MSVLHVQKYKIIGKILPRYRVFPYFCICKGIIFAMYKMRPAARARLFQRIVCAASANRRHKTRKRQKKGYIMKRTLLLFALAGVTPLSLMAQDDDMYFVPQKETKVATPKENKVSERPTYYSGLDCDVDEYNRRGRLKSYYQKIGNDSLGNDIIEFHAGDGTYGTEFDNDTLAVYPGSERYYDDAEDDYACSRNLGRFDGFYGWYDPFFYSYWGSLYWRSYYGWYSPWYYGYYDPWYYGGWYGWGYPYYYGWSAWHPAHYYAYRGPSGTMNHSRGALGGAGKSYAFGGVRRNGNGSTAYGNRNSSFSRSRSSSNRTNSGNRSYNFGGRRQSSNSSSYSRSVTQSPSRSSFGSGSFGGGRSGGSFGGGRSGGGGGDHFGGRR